jgi:predicted 3-demethylubiquinone-9 3-methyltransferase (glyoxalase superfamily)
MSAGMHNALAVTIESNDTKMIERAWKDLMKDYDGKAKKVRGSDEWMATGVLIVGINGVNPMQVYARWQPGVEGGTELTAWFQLGDQEFLASDRKEQYAEAEKILMKFAHQCKIEQTNNELGESEKKLKGLEKDLDKLKKDNDGYHKDIADAEKKIAEAKDNIIKNEVQQKDAVEMINLQKQLVEEIKLRLGDLKKQQ